MNFLAAQVTLSVLFTVALLVCLYLGAMWTALFFGLCLFGVLSTERHE